MAEYNISGKDSEFNWAALFIRSLDEHVGKLSELNLNLEFYDDKMGKYNYELAAVLVINMLIKLWGHLTDKEKENGRKLKEQLETAIKKLPLIEYKMSNSINGDKKTKKFNHDNFEIIKNIIFEFQLEIVGWIEKHHLGTPTRKDPTKAAIDM